MARSHNKKRNVGIIYEQIINYVCNKLMNKEKDKAEVAIKIIKNNFKKDTQLYKEYKLFKALASTHNVSDHLASSIITEAKKACNYMFNNEILEKEKSNLIRELNHNIGKGLIFEEKIKNYRTYATIQTLLNEWRKSSSDFDKVTEYEIKLHESLTSKNVITDTKVMPKVDKLTYKLMKEMFNKKYNSKLNETQQEIISAFIKDDEKLLENKYLALKSSSKILLEEYIKDCNNNILLEKQNNVFSKFKSLDEKDMSKENMQKFLTLAKLKEELIGED
tara:strand:- start:649 stop:1479 length:831 start_codon:yes stop_codon:yes gene_type:complete